MSSNSQYFRFILNNGHAGTAIYNDAGLSLWMDSALLWTSNAKPLVAGRPNSGESHDVAEAIGQAASSPMGQLILGSSRVDRIERSLKQPGEFNARVWRQYPGPSPETYGSDFTDCAVAFDNLEMDLESLFRTVEPDQARNDECYGHKFRELIILACTEVETLFKGFLDAHGHPGKSTADYIKALPVLHLDEWAVNIYRYNDYPELRPFYGWAPPNTSQTINWYHAYNEVKHDRRRNFRLATMKAAIDAAAAVAVLMAAQFGVGQYRNPFANTDSLFRVFRVTKIPEQRLAEQYIPPALEEGARWTPLPLTF